MKKILLIIFLFPICIKALGTNGTTHGISVTPSNDSCAGPAYYWSGSLNSPATEGLRITFYNLNGKQLGNTVDVWDKIYIYTEGTTSRHANCKISSTSKRFYECTAYDVTFVNKTPSRMDYIKTNTSTYYVNNDSAIKPVTANYKYFADANYSDRVYNPLWFTNDDSNQPNIFKNYFTSPAIVSEYMKIAGIDGVDPHSTSEYLFILEPIVKVNQCGTQKGIGNAIMSTADFAFFLFDSPASYGKFNNLGINCEIPKSLVLVEGGEHAKVGDIKFSLPKLPATCSSAGRDNFSWKDRSTGKVGVGMYIVYGDQICKNCGGSTYPIVYHTISLTQPFLNDSGKIRTLNENSNWYNKEETIDPNIYSKKPIYTVVLTPTTMKQIREDNKNIKYSNLSSKTFENFRTNFASIFK